VECNACSTRKDVLACSGHAPCLTGCAHARKRSPPHAQWEQEQ